MRPQGSLVLLLLLLPGLILAKWAFLADQSQCHLDCLNGGVCSFLVKRPEVHKCICLIGMFEGDRCEHRIEAAAISSSSSAVPEEAEGEEEEGEEDAAYEDEWTARDPAEEGTATGDDGATAEGGGARPLATGSGNTQRFLPETNTLATNLEHFAESRTRPLAAMREEQREEPALRGKPTATKSMKGKKKKKRPTTTTTEAPPVEEEEETAEGWMLTRRTGAHRSAATAAGQRMAHKAITALALTMVAALALA